MSGNPGFESDPEVVPQDYDFERYPKCPYCGCEMEDLCDLPDTLQSDEDLGTLVCNECGKEYTVMMHISYTFSTSAIENDADE